MSVCVGGSVGGGRAPWMRMCGGVCVCVVRVWCGVVGSGWMRGDDCGGGGGSVVVRWWCCW